MHRKKSEKKVIMGKKYFFLLVLIVLCVFFLKLSISIDSISPTWKNINSNSTDDTLYQGDTIRLFVTAQDAAGLDKAWLVTNENGKWNIDTETLRHYEPFEDLERISSINDVVVDTYEGNIHLRLCMPEHIDNKDGTCTVILDNPTQDGHVINSSSGVFSREYETEYMNNGFAFEKVFRSYIEWDISEIPDNAEILSTVFIYNGRYHGVNAKITEINNTMPSTSSDKLLFEELGKGTTYAAPGGFPVETIDKNIDLGSLALASFKSHLVNNWFAIGILSKNEKKEAYNIIAPEEFEHATPKPTLKVRYKLPYTLNGEFISSNVLQDLLVKSINDLEYTSSLPSGSNIKIQFSQDNVTWYDHNNVQNSWTQLSSGKHKIDLSKLKWSGGNFLYKCALSSDGSDTPTLEEITFESTNLYFNTMPHIFGGSMAEEVATFYWNNASVPSGTSVGWKIYISDIDGNVIETSENNFTIKDYYLGTPTPHITWELTATPAVSEIASATPSMTPTPDPEISFNPNIQVSSGPKTSPTIPDMSPSPSPTTDEKTFCQKPSCCNEIKEESLCATIKNCQWDSPLSSCIFLCTDHVCCNSIFPESQCQETNYCSWDDSVKKCVFSCSNENCCGLFSTQITCLTAKNCLWKRLLNLCKFQDSTIISPSKEPNIPIVIDPNKIYTNKCGSCDDNNPCTQDYCNGNTCVNKAYRTGALCGDNKICNENNICVSRVGEGKLCTFTLICQDGLHCSESLKCEKFICGDKKCQGRECSSCIDDCKEQNCRGNGYCDSDLGEDCSNAPKDCICPIKHVCAKERANSGNNGCYQVQCGDGVCDAVFESPEHCCVDCGCPKGYSCDDNILKCRDIKGNGICDPDECQTYPDDCGCDSCKCDALLFVEDTLEGIAGEDAHLDLSIKNTGVLKDSYAIVLIRNGKKKTVREISLGSNIKAPVTVPIKIPPVKTIVQIGIIGKKMNQLIKKEITLVPKSSSIIPGLSLNTLVMIISFIGFFFFIFLYYKKKKKEKEGQKSSNLPQQQYYYQQQNLYGGQRRM